jgi:glutathione peroxidase
MTDANSQNVYDFSALALDGHEVPLAQYRGKVLLIVNTASKCGFTPQYAGLEELYRNYKDRGVVVLGFPCNQFGGQEPGSEAEIAEFCESKYGVTFPMFAKIEVNGANTHPLFQYLKHQKAGFLGALGVEAIKWNFTKFLVNANGVVVKRLAPSATPAELGPEIDKILSRDI